MEDQAYSELKKTTWLGVGVGVARKTKSHQQDIEANITRQEAIGKGPEPDGRQLGVGWMDCHLSVC